ncbi:Hypothetical Protein FCC1311_041062 [Hondaea fermentalgiana]|uniref:Uncharacterized protein n=1 Tax=Hondaea fermentalgiana TaxID=2315210 RepID=A0A2R5GGV8_9STRA|nr:Hypothetical Protein FCC1311_041062 [Hondaea fermentalgiana]|eukprot:GBG27883.1 Hypothetical Protein FCC1311_041062 [Hondaea fermentalgiana]
MRGCSGAMLGLAVAAKKCRFDCPRHSKVKWKDECCNSIYDCKCDKGYKRVAHKNKCVKIDDEQEVPEKDPIKCPGGRKKSKCCENEKCYKKKFGVWNFTVDDDEGLVDNDEDLVDDDTPGVDKDSDDDDEDDIEVDGDDEGDIIEEDDELFPIGELLEESEEEETGVSFRASIMDFLEQDQTVSCPRSIVCAKGTKPCQKDGCPRNKAKNCCCKCKRGRMKDNGKCWCPPPKPTPAPTKAPKECAGYTKCKKKPNSKRYFHKGKGKCMCKCKKGFKKENGECKPKLCFYKTKCLKTEVLTK